MEETKYFEGIVGTKHFVFICWVAEKCVQIMCHIK